MTMESIILSNSMCIHCRLAMVLTSSLMETTGLLGCAVHECVCKHVRVWSRENCTNSYKLVKNNKTFPFCSLFFFFFPYHSLPHFYGPSFFPMNIFTKTPKFIYPWKFEKVLPFIHFPL